MATDSPDRYRLISTEVEAIQWTGDNEQELIAFAGHNFSYIHPDDRDDDPDATGSYLNKYSAWKLMYDNDYLVKYSNGTFQAFQPEKFTTTFELASSPPSDDLTRLSLIEQTLSLLHRYDSGESLLWYPTDHGIHLSLDCSDTFAWATADSEPIETLEDVALLQSACQDADKYGTYVETLYAARRRHMRPMPLFIEKLREPNIPDLNRVADILEECGPVRKSNDFFE